MVKEEGQRWIDAATSDLNAAELLLTKGNYHNSAFHAQQAAEKALKGLLRLLGHVAWGHNCFDLLAQIKNLLPDLVAPDNLSDMAQRLDSHYIPSRYPDAFPSGTPAEHYDKATAQQSMADAQNILAFVRNNKP